MLDFVSALGVGSSSGKLMERVSAMISKKNYSISSYNWRWTAITSFHNNWGLNDSFENNCAFA